MKSINLLILLLGLSLQLNSQDFCKKESIASIILNTDINYHIDREHVDLSNVFRDNRTTYIGFIGNNKKRIDFSILSIERDLKEPFRYRVRGTTKVYFEELRHFIGEFLLENQYIYSGKLDNDVSYAEAIVKQGFSLLSYELKEDDNLRNSGVFKGHLFVSWYMDTLNNIHYDSTLDYYPNYFNFSFRGSWVNKKTKEEISTKWSHYRIPYSGDLDIGASEFSPNPKYYAVGWADYVVDVFGANALIEYALEKEKGNYQLGIINDSDGYTNLRKNPNVSSQIIARIHKDEYFFYETIKGSMWSRVKTLEEEEEGYIHNSRIQTVSDATNGTTKKR